jgi:hypothetical protein
MNQPAQDSTIGMWQGQVFNSDWPTLSFKPHSECSSGWPLSNQPLPPGSTELQASQRPSQGPAG